MRGFIVWLVSGLVIMGLFLAFVNSGWPGEAAECVYETPNTCYCEAFDLAEVEAGAPGVRQPVNTWFNLYAIFTSLLVAVYVYKDRKALAGSEGPNGMMSNSAVPDLYIFAVLFLGLGSMWFHGSLTAWGSTLDGVSMFVFTAFLIFYSIRRVWKSDLLFWVGYIATVVAFSILDAFRLLPILYAILILVGAYLIVEVYIWVRTGQVMQGKTSTRLLWIGAIVSILAATGFWVVSQTGGVLCFPDSFFQPHGLLWHPLAGVTATLLYFYWRSANDHS